MISRDRRAELRARCVDALNVPTGRRPDGDAEARFCLASARRTLERVEHAEASSDNEDRLFVELRAACAEVEILQACVQVMPELLDAIDQIGADPGARTSAAAARVGVDERDQYVSRVREAMSLDNMALEKADYIDALEELATDIEGMLDAARAELDEEVGNG